MPRFITKPAQIVFACDALEPTKHSPCISLIHMYPPGSQKGAGKRCRTERLGTEKSLRRTSHRKTVDRLSRIHDSRPVARPACHQADFVTRGNTIARDIVLQRPASSREESRHLSHVLWRPLTSSLDCTDVNTVALSPRGDANGTFDFARSRPRTARCGAGEMQIGGRSAAVPAISAGPH